MMQRSLHIFSLEVQKVVLPAAATISEIYINTLLVFKTRDSNNSYWNMIMEILPYSGLSCASPTQNVDLQTNIFEQEPVISCVWLFCAHCRSKFLLYLYILPSLLGVIFFLFFLIAELHFFLLSAKVKDYLLGFFKTLFFPPPLSWGRL